MASYIANSSASVVRPRKSRTKGALATFWANAAPSEGGSWPFAAGFILFMILWAAANSFALASRAWDPSPYILLNLFSSMLAGL